MTRSAGQRKFHFKSIRPKDPNVKPFNEWVPPNRTFYIKFRAWLREASYGESAIKIYGTAVRLALGWLDKPYWEIDLDTDLDRVREYIATHYERESTRASYLKGIAKLEEYLRFRRGKPAPEKRINWQHYVGPLPDWLTADVRAYVVHCRRGWPLEQQHEITREFLSHLTQYLRWAADHSHLNDATDLTPALWFEYLDRRLEAGISPITVNGELCHLQNLLRFLADQGRAVCRRMLRVEPLKQPPRLPRDVPLDQLRLLRQEIEGDATASHAGIRRMGVMDRAWWHLMLHSGLRVGEIRRLRLVDLDLEARKIRIEQSKGLKDRIVFLSQATMEALQAYLDVRGPTSTDHVFLFRHKRLSKSYCSQRLRTYGRRCGVKITCHQLRHTCATLLLNAGAPILAVQTILGHKYIDTTLAYARLYDGTVAADYYRAMGQVEARMELGGSDTDDSPPNGGYLLALVDALGDGTLNENQRETVHTLRQGILALVEVAMV
jgi:site-specific recombinase XerD